MLQALTAELDWAKAKEAVFPALMTLPREAFIGKERNIVPFLTTLPGIDPLAEKLDPDAVAEAIVLDLEEMRAPVAWGGARRTSDALSLAVEVTEREALASRFRTALAARGERIRALRPRYEARGSIEQAFGEPLAIGEIKAAFDKLLSRLGGIAVDSPSAFVRVELLRLAERSHGGTLGDLLATLSLLPEDRLIGHERALAPLLSEMDRASRDLASKLDPEAVAEALVRDLEERRPEARLSESYVEIFDGLTLLEMVVNDPQQHFGGRFLSPLRARLERIMRQRKGYALASLNELEIERRFDSIFSALTIALTKQQIAQFRKELGSDVASTAWDAVHRLIPFQQAGQPLVHELVNLFERSLTRALGEGREATTWGHVLGLCLVSLRTLAPKSRFPVPLEPFKRALPTLMNLPNEHDATKELLRALQERFVESAPVA